MRRDSQASVPLTQFSRTCKRWPMSSGRAAAPHLSTYSRLELLMRERYTVEQLVNLDAGAFREGLNAFLQLDDATMEGYTDPQRQRDLSVRFRWGHNHDFGTFALQGEMQNRHFWLLSSYIDQFGLPESLDGQRVLDIGAWTGGTSLLLHAMGAEVVAIEEVRKYAEAIEYLAHAFSLTRLSVIQASLFDCHGSLFDDRFDYVLFAGVLYHVLTRFSPCDTPSTPCATEERACSRRTPSLPKARF